jgi:hypothetical protein
MEKKKTKRSEVKYPGLDPSVHPKPRQEYIDFDYIDKLNDDEKKFLSNFNEEYMSGSFQHKGNKLHRTKEERKDCYDRNNARNRDISSVHKARAMPFSQAMLENLEENEKAINPESTEDALITLMDLKEESKTTSLLHIEKPKSKGRRK